MQINISHEIPIGLIFVQVFNFSIFISLLVYLIYKKVLPILKKQKDTFLSDQQLAIETEAKNIQILKKWEMDIQKLEEQKKTLDQQVQLALNNQQMEWKKQEDKQCYILSQEVKRDFEQQKFQKYKALKNQLWERILLKTKEKLFNLTAQKKEEINQRIIKQLGGLS